MKTVRIIILLLATSIIMSCTKEYSEPQSSVGNTSNNAGSENNSENYIEISLLGKGAGNINVNYKPSDVVAYYKCGIANNISSMKYTKEKSINYNYLNPLTDYTFRAIAYDTADKILSNQTVTYRTDQPPYTNYLRPSGSFYELSYATMRKESLANGYSQKILQFYGTQEGYWLQVYWTSEAYENIDRYWDDGTYTIEEPGSGHHVYYARYNTNTNYISNLYGGKVTIQHSGNVYNITVKDNIGMIVVKFAGTIN